MRIKKLTILLLLILAFLVGCGITGKVVYEEQPEIVEEPVREEIPQKEITEKEEIKQVTEPVQDEEIESEEEPKKYYDLKLLEEDINELVDISYNFSRHNVQPDYVQNSDMKYYVIHTISNEEDHINDVNNFCGKYCAKNWDEWKFFMGNMSSVKALHSILTRENFSNEYHYNDYLAHACYVNNTIIEKSYDVENGKVMEYQFILWRQDPFGIFEGAYDDTLLIYKIYCSPNMTVFIRPRWDVFKISFPVASMSDTYRTWNNYIKPLREELLGIANKLLARCPADKEFFEDYTFPEYYKSEMFSVYWRTYYQFYWNLTRSIKVGVEPSKYKEGKYLLKEINVSFTNNDDVNLYYIALKIIVTPDDKTEVDYYDHKVSGILRPGKSIIRDFRKKEIEFSNNVTIEATLYTIIDKQDIRPLKVTFNKDGSIIG